MEPIDATHSPSWTRLNFLDICKVVSNVALEAGKMILEALSVPMNVHLKSPVDLVTDTDRKVEGFLIKTLLTHYPQSKFLAEEDVSSAESETVGKKAEVLGDEPTWIIDPIDGTTNFVHKYPIFCVSIALAVGKQVVVGVVYNPQLNELFTATRGGGAFLNGNPIHVASTASLDKAIISTNIGVDRTPEGAEFLTQNLRTLLLNNVQSTRSGGSSAWEMSSVACGRLDAFYEQGIHSWDIAAASLLVQEAGGVVTSLNGSPLDLLNRQVLCGNQQIDYLLSYAFCKHLLCFTHGSNNNLVACLTICQKSSGADVEWEEQTELEVSVVRVVRC
eukprot:Phypoly_transcript_08336.p1 GENE.Phypoly_transcript_08336~~Phypoly_transcript_08336.p1  ORF type:complete len:365 (+),score=47.12 Phypoly_transcript_08336:100-1095(+)